MAHRFRPCCSVSLLALLAAQVTAQDAPRVEVRLWPLVEHARQEDGGQLDNLLFLYHRRTGADGATRSFNILNYLEAGDFRSVLPLYFAYGPDDERRRMLVPAWFQGPGWWAAPPLLSAAWDRADGGRSTWITPLVHVGRGADGRVSDLHALTYLQGRDYRVLFPLAYSAGEEGRKHRGLVPLYFDGPGYWTTPLLLSGAWSGDDGGRSTWLTPLFHRDSDREGKTTSFHVLNWFHDREGDLILPLAWRHGDDRGLLPIGFAGRDYWCSPFLLSGSWRNDAGGRTTWLTPLYHRRSAGDGTVGSQHLLNWFSWGDNEVLFPLAWRSGPAGARSGAVLPFWFQGRDWWFAPPLLSGGGRAADGTRSTWVTPLFHQSSGPGRSSMHLLNYLRGQEGGDHDAQGRPLPASGYEALLPLYWRSWRQVDGVTSDRSLLLPLWYRDERRLVVPLALSARWQDGDGGRHTWITPLAHRSSRADGSLASQHLLTWFETARRGAPDAEGRPSGSELRMLFPLWWQSRSWAGGQTQRSSGLLPLYVGGDGYRVVPPLLSAWSRTQDGGDSLWITPLFHRKRDAAGATTSLHALNYVSTADRGYVLPLAWWSRNGDGSAGLIPFWFQGRDRWVCPPALSGWRRDAGGDSLWITPLFHRNRDAAGATTSLHALNYYRSGPDGGAHRGLVPLWFSGPGYWAAPLGLSARWTRSDGGTSTWITPLAHVDRKADGEVQDMHLLNYVQSGTTRMLLPIAWRSGEAGARHWGILPLGLGGPGYTVIPPALSARWRRDDGGTSTWITPLFHQGRDAQGGVSDWHLLNYARSGDTATLFPLVWSDPKNLVVAPLYYRHDGADGRHQGVFPLYFQGPDYWTAPLLLSGRWGAAEGRQTTWISPLYHRSTAGGSLRHSHLLNYVATPTWKSLVPLWWDWKTDAGGRRSLALPLYYQHRKADGDFTASVLPIFSYHSGKSLDTSLAYQLHPFVRQSTAEGQEINVLWRLFHLREQGQSSQVMVGPLWWSQRHEDKPLSWRVLGGLFGSDYDAQRKASHPVLFWMHFTGA